jgi:hypothetical protein
LKNITSCLCAPCVSLRQKFCLKCKTFRDSTENNSSLPSQCNISKSLIPERTFSPRRAGGTRSFE